MLKLLPLLMLCIALPVMAQSGLTPLETRWLQAGSPVIAYAREQGLPIDIVVQPQDAPNAVPLALGFDGGRCKLVLSMRGNAQAEAVLQGVPVEQRGLMIEAMTAHEIGHCQRYAQGNWHVLPAGFVDLAAKSMGAAELRETRREEGYADLVALAWMHSRHLADYGAVLAWMGSVREQEGAAGGSHATQAWLVLAGGEHAFDGAASLFEQAQVLWRKGLSGDKG
ncbi:MULTISPECIES: hypothetical protein [unclassified Janthinobacterium]|uniref:hypothetical protein n=1 Tax=unclassified Janthinobacterium TaxID=2610881 RepID=UPI00161B5155|nr:MULTISPECIES: hypothetical protein [unclassified Janthinobacterium]MBB5607888.1 hypothetical protein [Janthinobacterium sp. S3T4]MBB5613371.1 hypothetical protein [Janthinobacterium sp. S3M3]